MFFQKDQSPASGGSGGCRTRPQIPIYSLSRGARTFVLEQTGSVGNFENERRWSRHSSNHWPVEGACERWRGGFRYAASEMPDCDRSEGLIEYRAPPIEQPEFPAARSGPSEFLHVAASPTRQSSNSKRGQDRNQENLSWVASCLRCGLNLLDVRCFSSVGPVAQRLEQRTHHALCNRCLLCFSSAYEATGWVQLGGFGHDCGGFGLSNGLSFGPKQSLVSG